MRSTRGAWYAETSLRFIALTSSAKRHITRAETVTVTTHPDPATRQVKELKAGTGLAAAASFKHVP